MEKKKMGLINNILKKDSSILAAYLFGSQSKGKSNKYSDIDIAILFDDTVRGEDYTDKQITIMGNLSDALNKEIDIVVLNRAPLFLKYHILKEGVKVYERYGRNEHNFEAQTITHYLDFLPIKNKIENGLLSKIKGV